MQALLMLFIAVGGLLTVSRPAAADETTAETTADRSLIPNDHHVHVLSPTLIAHWKSLGVPFSRSDEAYSKPHEFLKQAGVQRAFLISMAYLYGSEDFQTVAEIRRREHELVRAENDYLAEQVRLHPDRFVGFFSVHPLQPYAMEELQRCKERPELTGVKLHFPACGIELRNKSHRAKLKELFLWCSENATPMLVHVSGIGETFGAAEADAFWRELVLPHPKLSLYLAHAGGSGGYTPRTAAILEGYQALCKQNATFEKAAIYFDMSGAILDREYDGSPETKPKQREQLAKTMREIGLERFLFASDYPVFDPVAMRQILRDRLPLTSQEIDALLANCSPLFEQLSRE